MSLFCVGDIHGCNIQLKEILNDIYVHIADNKIENPEICFVGDYVDRGPNSKGVIDTLIDARKSRPDIKHIFLMGNHEDMLLNHPQGFLSNGGVQTLQSYGYLSGSEGYYDVMAKIDSGFKPLDSIPADHMEFYKNLLFFYEKDFVGVAHAGISDHGRAFENSDEYLLWDRSLRMTSHPYYKYTVHGHTPMKRPVYNECVAYIDTGCVFGGYLSAVFIPDTVKPDVDDFVWFKSSAFLKY